MTFALAMSFLSAKNSSQKQSSKKLTGQILPRSTPEALDFYQKIIIQTHAKPFNSEYLVTGTKPAQTVQRVGNANFYWLEHVEIFLPLWTLKINHSHNFQLPKRTWRPVIFPEHEILTSASRNHKRDKSTEVQSFQLLNTLIGDNLKSAAKKEKLRIQGRLSCSALTTSGIHLAHP